jgi:hypothetical protein
MKNKIVTFTAQVDEDCAAEIRKELEWIAENWGLIEAGTSGAHDQPESCAYSLLVEDELEDTEDLSDGIADLPPEPSEVERHQLLECFAALGVTVIVCGR